MVNKIIPEETQLMVPMRDAVGNVIAEDGATYPVRYTYDTQGHRTSLSTTRDGVTWDTTSWAYDAATGNCLSKTYADNSTVTYTYTPDNLLLRTTYASGRWKENVYDERRQVVGTISSDGENDATMQRDAYGRIVLASNNVASAIYALANIGTATNEAVNAGTNAFAITRTLDAYDRLNGLVIPSIGYSLGYSYADDGLLASVSNGDAVVTYAYTPDRRDAGYAIAFSGSGTFVRSVTRDPYRREIVTGITNAIGGISHCLAYGYDALARPVTRNGDAFAYNTRGEVESAMIDGNTETHGYDFIGNSLLATFNGATITYTANNLNQYVSILRASAFPREITHDADGNMTNDGVFTYTYDSASRLTSVSSNGILLVTNQYDCRGRRVRKITQTATHTFFYDDWNLIYEQVANTNGTVDTYHYFWGHDLSGSLQGAGGVGGLLYVKQNGTIFVPHADAMGNILRYTDTAGNVVAAYTYDAFGATISQSGTMRGVFRHRFSTKYYDEETGLYYYGYRFYSPSLMRWLNRDPIGEKGGVNLYCFIINAPLAKVDLLGNEKLSLSYDFALDTNWLGKMLNWSTQSRLSVKEAEKDIRNRVKPYSSTGKGRCKCIENITIAGHGNEGWIILGDEPRNLLTALEFKNYFNKSTSGRYFPAEIFSLLEAVSELACDHLTVRFATCLSGKGEAGRDLMSQLKMFFGDSTTITLYDYDLYFMFNRVVPKLY